MAPTSEPPERSALFAAVQAAFASEGWACSAVPGRAVLRAGFEAHHARVELHAQAFPEMNAVSVVAESSVALPDPLRRERLAELLLRANQSLTVGNFEMNWEAGRALFRATNLFATAEADSGILRGLVQVAVMEMDRITPLVALIARSSGPDLAALDLPALMNREDLLPGPSGEADPR